MTKFGRKYAHGISLTAIGLLIVFIAVTTASNLFHNHRDLVERDDCPACLWLQLSQDSDRGPSPAEHIIAEFTATVLLPPPANQEAPVAEDRTGYQPIRAPPTC